MWFQNHEAQQHVLINEAEGEGHSLLDFASTWRPCDVLMALQTPNLNNLGVFLVAENRRHAALLAVNRQDKKVRITDSDVNIMLASFLSSR